MKSEGKLKASYEKQKINFETNQQEKDHSIDLAISETQKKIESLEIHLRKLQADKQKNLQRSFRSYEEFRQSAIEQSEKSKTPN